MKLNLANFLTLLRIAAIPVVVVCFYSPLDYARPIAAVLFGLAAVTDMIDGWVARRFGQTSRFGEFLDPVADKLMVATALVLLVQADPSVPMAIAAAVIIGREIAISGLREWMAELGSRTKVAVSEIGKFKTAMQMVAIILLIYREDLWTLPTRTVGLVLLYIAVALTLWSMTLYLRAAWPSLKGEGRGGRLSDSGPRA